MLSQKWSNGSSSRHGTMLQHNRWQLKRIHEIRKLCHKIQSKTFYQTIVSVKTKFSQRLWPQAQLTTVAEGSLLSDYQRIVHFSYYVKTQCAIESIVDSAVETRTGACCSAGEMGQWPRFTSQHPYKVLPEIQGRQPQSRKIRATIGKRVIS